MKKSDLAILTERASLLTEIYEHSIGKLVAGLEASFSGIATADPELAIDILDQLNAGVPELKKMIEERKLRSEQIRARVMGNLPDSLEFEEEDELPPNVVPIKRDN